MCQSLSPPGIIDPHLGQRCVQLENLAFAFHLPHADLTRELRGGQAMPLQGESAVQGFLAAVPDMVEGNLLQERWSGLQVRLARSGWGPALGRAGLWGQRKSLYEIFTVGNAG